MLALLAAVASSPGIEARRLGRLTGLSDALLAAMVERLRVEGCLSPDERVRLLPEGRLRLERGIDALASAVGDERRFVEPCPTLPLKLRGTFREVFCFLYRVQPALLRKLIPGVLQPLERMGSGWVSVLFVSVSDVRPSWTPPPAGQCWYEVSVRVHVCFRDWQERLRLGVYFLASFMNSAWLAFIGSTIREFKFHNFRVCPVAMLQDGSESVLSFESVEDGEMVAVLEGSSAVESPSLLGSASEVQDLIQVPQAFAWSPEEEQVYVLEIQGDPWVPRPVRPVAVYNGFFAHQGLREAALDSTWRMQEIGVEWLPLARERWLKGPPRLPPWGSP